MAGPDGSASSFALALLSPLADLLGSFRCLSYTCLLASWARCYNEREVWCFSLRYG